MGSATNTTSVQVQRTPPMALLIASAVALVLAVLAIGPATPAIAQDASPAPEPLQGAQATPLPEGFNRKMADKVDEIVAEVLPVRQLPSAPDVTFRSIDEATFRTELEALFRAEYSDEYIAAEDALLTRLGLLDADDDLEELILSLYESQVLAYYDPAVKTFSLVGPVEKIGPLESVVVAHEYGHALQDAQWDLDGSRVTDLSQADTILAHQALAEGDATAVMNDWTARELRLRDLLRVAGQALSKQDQKILRRVPPILRRQLEFPYIDGLAFVMALRGRGDWAAVDNAWNARPESTEQIMHPELYPDEKPIPVNLPDVAALVGDGWETSYEQTMGEMQIGVWVADGRKPVELWPKLPGQLPRSEAAAGWGGDRLFSLDGPDGAWAVVWQTAWDTPTDAKQFRKAATAALKDLPAEHSVSDVDIDGGLSSPVLILVADSRGTLDTIEEALAREF